MKLTYRSLHRIAAGLFALSALLNAAETRIVLAQDETGSPECRAQCNADRDAAVSDCDQSLSSCLADGSGDSRCYAIHNRCVASAEDQRRQCKAQCRALLTSAIECTQAEQTANPEVSRRPDALLAPVSLPLEGVPDCSACQEQFEQDVNTCGLCTPEDSSCDNRTCIEQAKKRLRRCMRTCVPPLFQSNALLLTGADR
jgi:hypothetical protein